MRHRQGAFTLIEVLVAVMLLSIGLAASLAAFALASQWATSATRLHDAVRLAEAELVLATTPAGEPSLQSYSRVVKPFACKISYADRSHGLSLATVVIEWTERGVTRSFTLSQVFDADRRHAPAAHMN